MPAAAVIPAPIAYVNFVAIKKLVVETPGASNCVCLRRLAILKGFVNSYRHLL